MASSPLSSIVKVISSVTRGIVNIAPAVSRSLGKVLIGLGKDLFGKGLVGELGGSLFSALGKSIGISKDIAKAKGEASNRGNSPKGIGKILGGVFTKIIGKRNNSIEGKDNNKLDQAGSSVVPKDTRTFSVINRLFVSLGKVTKPLQPVVKRLISVFSIAGKTLRFFIGIGTSLITLGFRLVKSFVGILASVGSLVSGLSSLPSSIVRASQKISSIGSTILDTFTGIPNKLESAFGGIISLIRSYSPAEAKQIEIAFGRLRATIGQILTPLAPMISNIALNIARIIKDASSQIDIKGLFKWIVFLMSLTVGIVIAVVKLVIKIIEKIRSIFQGGGQDIASSLMELQDKILGLVASIWQSILDLVASWLPKVLEYLSTAIPVLIQSIVPLIQRGITILGPVIRKGLDILVKALGWLLRQLPSWLVMLRQQIIQFISYLLTQLPDWLMTLGEYLVQLLADLLIGLGTAILEYLPNLFDDLIKLLESLWVFVKRSFLNFIYSVPRMFLNLGNMVWNALKSSLPWWLKRSLGISDSSDQYPEQLTPGQTQGQEQGISLNKLSTPEGAMQGIANFLKGAGLGEVGSVFDDMSKMFSGLFEKPDDRDLPFESKGVTTGSIEDLGKKAREAALGVSGDPQKITAESSKQTSDNTKAIRDSMQILVTNNASDDIARIVQQAEATNKSIQVLNRASKESINVDKQEKMRLEMSIDEMVYQQQKTNRLLMRMVYGQKEIVEIERQREFGYQRAK